MVVELDMVFDLNEISFSGYCLMGNWLLIVWLFDKCVGY